MWIFIFPLTKRLFTFFTASLYIKKWNYTKKGEKNHANSDKNQYPLWLKIAANMKVSSDAYELRIAFDILTDFQSFMDFDRNSIKSLLKACIKNIYAIAADFPNGIAAENAVLGMNIIMI